MNEKEKETKNNKNDDEIIFDVLKLFINWFMLFFAHHNVR
jgi:hypothetical protein